MKRHPHVTLTSPARHADVETCSAERREEKGIEENKSTVATSAPALPGTGDTPRQPHRFTKPTLDEVKLLFASVGMEPREAEAFFDYYEMVGWEVGRGKKMKDVAAAVRNWKRRKENDNRTRSTIGNQHHDRNRGTFNEGRAKDYEL